MIAIIRVRTIKYDDNKPHESLPPAELLSLDPLGTESIAWVCVCVWGGRLKGPGA